MMMSSPVGYLAATLNRSFYSNRDYAVQEMWFVVRTHRGSRASIDLLRSFENVGHTAQRRTHLYASRTRHRYEVSRSHTATDAEDGLQEGRLYSCQGD